MVTQKVKFQGAMVSRSYFQEFLKMVRNFQPAFPLNIHRVVDGYDVTLSDELIIKARGKGRAYFVLSHPSFITAFKKKGD